jgi:hypothetical protein
LYRIRSSFNDTYAAPNDRKISEHRTKRRVKKAVMSQLKHIISTCCSKAFVITGVFFDHQLNLTPTEHNILCHGRDRNSNIVHNLMLEAQNVTQAESASFFRWKRKGRESNLLRPLKALRSVHFFSSYSSILRKLCGPFLASDYGRRPKFYSRLS